jgi:hypothetical protein
VIVPPKILKDIAKLFAVDVKIGCYTDVKTKPNITIYPSSKPSSGSQTNEEVIKKTHKTYRLILKKSVDNS